MLGHNFVANQCSQNLHFCLHLPLTAFPTGMNCARCSLTITPDHRVEGVQCTLLCLPCVLWETQRLGTRPLCTYTTASREYALTASDVQSLSFVCKRNYRYNINIPMRLFIRAEFELLRERKDERESIQYHVLREERDARIRRLPFDTSIIPLHSVSFVFGDYLNVGHNKTTRRHVVRCFYCLELANAAAAHLSLDSSIIFCANLDLIVLRFLVNSAVYTVHPKTRKPMLGSDIATPQQVAEHMTDQQCLLEHMITTLYSGIEIFMGTRSRAKAALALPMYGRLRLARQNSAVKRLHTELVKTILPKEADYLLTLPATAIRIHRCIQYDRPVAQVAEELLFYHRNCNTVERRTAHISQILYKYALTQQSAPIVWTNFISGNYDLDGDELAARAQAHCLSVYNCGSIANYFQLLVENMEYQKYGNDCCWLHGLLQGVRVVRDRSRLMYGSDSSSSSSDESVAVVEEEEMAV